MIVNFLSALFALSFCAISFKVISYRKKERIAIGSKNSEILERFISAQRNFFEYSAIFLLLLYIVEKNDYLPKLAIIGFAAVFATARLIHFVSLTKIEPASIAAQKPNFKFRIKAMMLTFFAIISLASVILIKSLA